MCLCVFVQTLCLLSFWLLVRQFLTERREKQTDETQLSDVKVEGHTTGESVCVCVCVGRETRERDDERERGDEREREGV